MDPASYRRTQLAIASAQNAQVQAAAREKEAQAREQRISALQEAMLSAVSCRESAVAALGSLLLVPLCRSLVVAPVAFTSYCVLQTYRSLNRA